MKRNRLNERQRTQKADYIRRMEIEQMSERKPLSKARDDFKRPAYQARSMIAEQGKQIEHESVTEYLAKKYDIKTGVSAGGQKEIDTVQSIVKGTAEAKKRD